MNNLAAGYRQCVAFILGFFSIFVFGIAPVYAQAGAYQVPFGGLESHSTNISGMDKWEEVLRRIDANPKPLQPWLNNNRILKRLPFPDAVEKINALVNRYDYIADIANWGVSDYWATPREFFVNGGDCEDFVIAKYAWLRFLGTPEKRLRLAVVYDRISNRMHSVLIVYINGKAMMLDNQVRDIRDSRTSHRYRIIYSINRNGWWRPKSSAGPELSASGGADSNIEPAGGPAGGDELQLPGQCDSLAGCLNALEPAGRL